MAAAVRCACDGGVQTILIDRLDKKNALTGPMYDAIADALAAADADPAIRVSLVTGGDTCFTAGNDLNDFLDAPPGHEESPAGRFLRVLAAAAKPVAAAVAGPAVGVGTTMLLHCDLVYAADTAVFQLPFVSLGLVPEAGATLLLPRLAGMARATELLLLAQKFDADFAREIGLVTDVCAAADLLEFARERCDRLAAQPPAAVRMTKRLLRHGTSESVAARMREEGDIFTERLRQPEAIEAMLAFREKRAPDWNRFE